MINFIRKSDDPYILEFGTADVNEICNKEKAVPEEWKGVQPIHTPGGMQEMLTLSESGLYFFLARSDKPKALPFQKWLAGDVVPSIRKTGGYMLTKADDTPESIMARAVLDLGVAGRTGLDMGSGTGVLAIVAAKCGAAHVDAVDIDDWADANCRENVAANGVADRVSPMLGDVRRIAGRRYDFILANINRNILAADMPAYAAALAAGGDLVMSGFLEADLPAIAGAAAREGLTLAGSASRDGWMLAHVRRP